MCNTDTLGRDKLTHAHKQEPKEEWDHLHFCPLILAMHCTIKNMQWEKFCCLVQKFKHTTQLVPAGAHHSTDLRDNFIIQLHDVPTWSHDQGCRTRTLYLCLQHSSILVTKKNGKEVPRVCIHTSMAPSQRQQLFSTLLYEGFWCS